jgi:predicted ATPase/class 3 adenylate cyclase
MTSLPSPSIQIRTFLYTDLQGSTSLWEQFPDSIEDAIARHDEILRETVIKHNGSIFRVVGDGLCAVFENASQALEAALQAQIALQAEPWGEIGSLNVRMAIHTGEVEAYGNDFIGSSLNRIGRLLGVAHGGQILISQATQLLVRDSLPGGASLLDLGAIRLRDLSQPELIFQLAHPTLPDEFPPLVSLDERPNNLPIQISALIGREVELEEISSRLSSNGNRLLTLTGPGGTGKTRLSLQVAADQIDRFADGVYFVDLASIWDPDGVLPAIARTLGIHKTSNRPILDELKNRLHGQEILLLLDNFEQVIPAAPLVMDLLQTCPRLKMLATSREPLRLRGEQNFPVPPLDLPQTGFKLTNVDEIVHFAAVRLFVERAQAVRPDFKVTPENASAIVEICRRLDGLPLAIELAASRIKLFPPHTLLQRLSSSLRLLTGGARDLPTRQQTLRDTIDWSFNLLDIDEQRLFTVLSVFRGGCSIEAIETIATSLHPILEIGTDPLVLLDSLIDKSLLRQVSDPYGDPRLVMFATIYDFAVEKLTAHPQLKDAANRAHADYYADFAYYRWGLLADESSGEALHKIDLDLENLRAAWSYWVDAKILEQLDKIRDCLWLLYERRGWYPAMVALSRDMLNALSTSTSTPERTVLEIVLQTNLASTLLITKGYFDNEVEQNFNRAFELIERNREIPQLFPVLSGLARYYSYRGEFEKAIRMGNQILSMADQLNDPDLYVAAHLILGTNLTFSKGLRVGLEHFEKGIASYVTVKHHPRPFRFGSDPGIACQMTSAINLWMLGFPDTALKRANETKDMAKRLYHPYSIAYATFHTGLLYLWSSVPYQALEHSQALLEMVDEYEFDIWKAVGLCLQGAALVRLGKIDEGLSQVHQGMEKYQGLTTPPIFWTLLLFNQAEAYLYAGKPDKGLAMFADSIISLEQNEEGALTAEFYRLRGDLYLAASEESTLQAEIDYQHALGFSQIHEARLFELRAATRLSRLWEKLGKHEQVVELLSGIYQAMTEGHNTVDMIEAKEFLEKNKN